MKKRRRLIWRLFPSYLLITLLSLLAVSWFASTYLRNFYLDQTAVDLALRLLAPTPADQARVVRIKNTHDLSCLWASSSVVDELRGRPGIKASPRGEPLRFSAAGSLE